MKVVCTQLSTIRWIGIAAVKTTSQLDVHFTLKWLCYTIGHYDKMVLVGTYFPIFDEDALELVTSSVSISK